MAYKEKTVQRGVVPVRAEAQGPVMDIEWGRTHLFIINGDWEPRHKNNAKMAAEAGLANKAAGVYVAGIIGEKPKGVEYSKATVGKIGESLEAIGKNTKEGDTVFLYITGHGGEDTFKVERGSLKYAKLIERMGEHLAGREIIFVSDACRSGEFVSALAESGKFAKVSAMSPGVEEEKTSCEYFSKPFWHALRTGLDVDGNNLATIEEAFWYALEGYKKYKPDTLGTYRETVPEVGKLSGVKEGVVMATAEWCGACKSMRPVFNSANMLLGGALQFYEIYSERGDFGGVKKPSTLPTFFIIRNGKIVAKKSEVMSLKELSEWMGKNGIVAGGTKEIFRDLYAKKDYESLAIAFDMGEIFRELGEEKALKMMEGLGKDKRPRVRRECANLLRDMKSVERKRGIKFGEGVWARAEKTALGLASDRDAEVREASMRALGKLVKAWRPEIVKVLIRGLYDKAIVARRAAFTLGNAARREADIRKAVPKLTKLLYSTDEKLQGNAASALEAAARRNKADIRKAVPRLAKIVSREKEQEKRIAEAIKKKKEGRGKGKPIVVRMGTSSERMDGRGYAAEALAAAAESGIDISEAVPALGVMLTHGSRGNRYSTARALRAAAESGIDISEAVPALVRVLYFKEHEHTKESAARALRAAAKNGTDISEAVPALAGILPDSDELAMRGATALEEAAKGGTDISGAVGALTRLVSDESVSARGTAVQALLAAAENGTDIGEAVPALANAALDDNRSIRGNAAKALKAARENGVDISDVVSALGEVGGEGGSGGEEGKRARIALEIIGEK